MDLSAYIIASGLGTMALDGIADWSHFNKTYLKCSQEYALKGKQDKLLIVGRMNEVHISVTPNLSIFFYPHLLEHKMLNVAFSTLPCSSWLYLPSPTRMNISLYTWQTNVKGITYNFGFYNYE